MSAISSIRSSGIGPMVGMNSRVVPWWARRVAASATNSGKEALEEGTGRWSPSRWPSPNEDENPRAPPSSDSATRRTMDPICVGVASSDEARSPITTRRTVE